MDVDVLDRLLPIVTLVIGALLTFFLQRSEGGYTRRLAAGDLLADLSRQVWSRSEPDGWMSFQVYLGRLRVYLREAGVPERVTRSLSEAAEAYWSAVEEIRGSDGQESWAMPDSHVAQTLNIAENRVHMFLRTGLRWRLGEWRQRRQVVRWVTDAQEAERKAKQGSG
ncbi:hypothetical protein [Nocardioides terrisoli]|uniref:hypothetical protein n=1 Tax=Nocardioides terrisoli TaxID=3388267 RepID=UPI00287B7B64|nr:hypothetical protein [Nocardioides marmorisolisilvae]